ncbi:MAG: hypothetical protein J7J11_01585 [Desulfurococcales archaeon]|nr:hypothetical protein [Desulfurococcales archaeon]
MRKVWEAYMNEGVMILHFNFIWDLVVSVAYLIPLLIVWRLRNRTSSEAAGSLNYVLAGFSIGFLVKLVGGVLYNYILQVPLLPVKMHEWGASFESVARTMWLYNTVFSIANLVSLIASLLLITYGVYRLVNILK